MKKRWLWPSLIALAVGLLTSCSEDEEVVVSNKMHLYGIDFEIDRGDVVRGSDNRLMELKEYVFEDHFVDANGDAQVVEVKGFTLSDNIRLNGNFSLSLYGTDGGASIYFTLSSEDRDSLSPGEYLWGDGKEPFTYVASFSSVGGGGAAQISEGAVMIGKAGADYSVEFDCKTEYGTTIHGKYIGPLTYSRVEKLDVMQHSEMRLDALLDTIRTELIAPQVSPDPITWTDPPMPDFNQGKAFFSSTGGVALTAIESTNNDKVDLALVYDKVKESVFFESPVKMGVWLSHNYEYKSTALNFPCHTRYMFAPDDFSDDDYEKIEASGQLDFVIEDESKVEFAINTDFPKFVFFESGRGVRGVIRIVQATSFALQKVDMSGWLLWGSPADLVSYINPAIFMDMKYVSF